MVRNPTCHIPPTLSHFWTPLGLNYRLRSQVLLHANCPPPLKDLGFLSDICFNTKKLTGASYNCFRSTTSPIRSIVLGRDLTIISLPPLLTPVRYLTDPEGMGPEKQNEVKAVFWKLEAALDTLGTFLGHNNMYEGGGEKTCLLL